jgi:PhnB protein
MAIHELFAYICVKDAAAAIAFYAKAFGAKEKFRLVEPSGRIGHAEVDFNGTLLMISEEYPEYGIAGPAPGGGTYLTLHLHVDDADAVIAQALAAGATMDNPVSDAFYGERGGSVRDPSGHRWSIGHSIEKVEPEEMQRRYTEMMKGG